MSYATLESSALSASPVELYLFQRGDDIWRYCTAEADILHAGQWWRAIPLLRSGIEQTQESGRSDITLALPASAGCVRGLTGHPPAHMTRLTILALHRDDDDAVAVWTGRVVSALFGQDEVELRCEPVFSSLKRLGLRRMYQTTCPLTLYSSACGVAREGHALTGTIHEVGRLSLRLPVAAPYPDNHFAGGLLVWGSQQRMIVANRGEVLRINADLAVGAQNTQATIYPGCDRSIATCAAKFSNQANFGGQPYIPRKNPMDGATRIF